MAAYKGVTINTSKGQADISRQIASIDKGSTSTKKSGSSGGSSKGIESNALVFDTPAYNAQFGGMTGEAQQKAIKSYSSKNPEMQKQATAFASSFYKPSEAIDAPIVADYSNMTPPAFAAADYTPVNQTSDAFVNSLTAPAQMQTSYDTQVAEAEAAAKKEQGALTKMTEKFNISDQYAKLQKQQGIPQMQKQLQEANIQLAQMQSQYQLQNQSLAQQTIPEPFVIGQQNELQKTAAITIGAQASYVQALQGNLELANHYVDKMTELQYQDFQVKYENQKYNLEIAQNYLTKAEAKQAKAMDFQLDMYKMNYSSFLDNKNQIWKNALSQGASSSELQSIARSQSDNDLAWAGQKYGQSAVERAQLYTESLQQQKLLGDLGVDATAPATLAQTQANVQQLTNLASLGGKSSAVGTSILTRKPAGFWGTVGKIATVVGIPGLVKDAYNKLTGKSQNFIADVEQVRSNLNLETLIQAKSRGATFGALSDQELKVLASAGTKMGTWAVKDKNGNTIHYNASEKDFTNELNKINNFAKLDAVLKGSAPEDVGVQIMEDGTYWTENPDGSLTRIR